MRFLLFMFMVLAGAGCSTTRTATPAASAPPAAVASAQASAPAPTATAGPPAAPQKEAVKPGNAGEIHCTRAKDVRRLRIESIQPKGCKLWYSSFSADK